MIKRDLEQEGYIVTISNDGYAALDIIADAQPDLVILDTNMPRINGFQLREMIREKHDIPIIMLSTIQDVSSVGDIMASELTMIQVNLSVFVSYL